MEILKCDLFPAFIESMKSAGMTADEQAALFSSAERFARMWEEITRPKIQAH
jgi:hypothetical protein